MSNKQESSEDKAKKFVGGMVLEWVRKWGIALMCGWLVVGSGLKESESLPRKEFESYAAGHEKWGGSVKDRIDSTLERIDLKLDRIEGRLDRALDKRMAGAPPVSTNGVARRP